MIEYINNVEGTAIKIKDWDFDKALKFINDLSPIEMQTSDNKRMVIYNRVGTSEKRIITILYEI